ncbi:hypothetical protein ACJ8S7_005066 [Klebsiella pneumoniae]|nr:hypothetical protein [Klebsiella pneumoniae]
MSLNLIARDYDPKTGITEEFWHNPIEGTVTIRKLQDVEKQVDMNKEMFNSHNRAEYGDSNGNHLVARIPLTVIELWKEQGFDWFKSTDKERRAWLDKPDNAVFKVRPGKLNGVTKSNLTMKAS